MVSIARQLNIEEFAVASTPGVRGERKTFILKLGRVQYILYVLLTLTALVNIYAIIYVATR